MQPRAGNRRLRRTAVITTTVLAGGVLASCASSSSPKSSTTAPYSSKVLLVGTYQGKAGRYKTIQAAVDAAQPGDWILIGPGDYHETDDHQNPPSATDADEGWMGGVLIETSDLHLRGMNRNSVIVDGTKAGAPTACDSGAKWQDFGVTGANGKPYGRDGIGIWEADNVSVDNLTICNFLAGSGSSGNEIWWNGGEGSAKIGLTGYEGSYLTATSTYFGGENTAAQYGIFSSDSAGPGIWSQLYANNFNDSGMYVGACQQACDMTISNAWMENNALGYSGTNSGGQIIVKDSQFDDNEDGFDTNTQIAGDPPAPQNGDCPNGGTSPITHTHSCWVFEDNYVHNNNNPSTPKAGSAAAGPTGTGMTVSGGRNDTVMDNRFVDNGAWGILFVPYPDSSTPSVGQTCSGTGGHQVAGLGCVYDPEGDALLHNTFVHDGYFGNPANSDFGQITISAHEPQNCFAGNSDPAGSAPSNLEQVQPTCGALTAKSNTGGPLLDQVLCDTGFGTCPKGAKYPLSKQVILTSVPKTLPTMPDPCAGVPNDLWCSSGSAGSSLGANGAHSPHVPGPLGLALVGSVTLTATASSRRRSRRR
jgi:hypothetical protein